MRSIFLSNMQRSEVSRIHLQDCGRWNMGVGKKIAQGCVEHAANPYPIH
jgi:hypothetical protein